MQLSQTSKNQWFKVCLFFKGYKNLQLKLLRHLYKLWSQNMQRRANTNQIKIHNSITSGQTSTIYERWSYIIKCCETANGPWGNLFCRLFLRGCDLTYLLLLYAVMLESWKLIKIFSHFGTRSFFSVDIIMKFKTNRFKMKKLSFSADFIVFV